MILVQKDYYLDHEGTPTDPELEDFLLIYKRERNPTFGEAVDGETDLDAVV